MSTEKWTPGPWHWVIHDHSLASLGVGQDPGLGDPLVMDVGPCPACTKRANPQEWKWGRCCTPSEANANLIAAAPELAQLHSMDLEVIDDVRALIQRGETNAALGALDAMEQVKVAALAKARGES